MSDEKPLKRAIDQLLRAYGYQQQLDELKLIELYNEQVGQMFVNHTKSVHVKDKVLYVQLDSASLKQELSYVKEALVEQLNKKIGKCLIEKIIVR